MWGIVFCGERAALLRFGGMGYGGVENVAILIDAKAFRNIMRDTFSLTHVHIVHESFNHQGELP